MQIVIDIPKYVYDLAVHENIIVDADIEKVTTAIMSGKLLPKGHGKLVDANEVKKRMIPLDFGVQKWISEVDLDIYVPTVIEADSGVDN